MVVVILILAPISPPFFIGVVVLYHTSTNYSTTTKLYGTFNLVNGTFTKIKNNKYVQVSHF